jgi:hypothetical protein
MVEHLFPGFLEDPAEYAAAEAYWEQLWEQALALTGQWEEWESPWLQTKYANGTPFRDGDPIFSARCLSRRLGLRVIQNDPRGQTQQLGWWVDSLAVEWPGGEIKTLVIACSLSIQSAKIALKMMESWMLWGVVSVIRPQDGPPSIVRESA